MTNFIEQALDDSMMAIVALNSEQALIHKAVLQSRMALDILMSAQRETCAIIHTESVHICLITHKICLSHFKI